ncbi:lysophospholipid acyltransferase family protein [Cellulomonas composti]|uniref:1-acyl-sn-glycerol-3-phosphate acyltransferase n=1 Tax=Cellulomonas composti TaxID=266130 RepID=A0A511J6G7_9CELL|nr:lysophospholipid acyltransferase family protein [Cellulomonas composti]GEL93587.1 1-acyl-sn-glycerol-3-phosphate acyltransferase [Cellulomonas composti]
MTDVPSPRGPRWWRWLGVLLARVVWGTRVSGRDNVPRSGPVLLAANHTGVIDGPILVGAAPRPTHVLVKEEMFHGPLGLLLRSAGQIPVDREGGRGALTAALGVLRRGGVVGIFPEGNRGKGDASGARAGIAWLALNGHAPVVPVAVLGTRRTGESVGHVPGARRRLAVVFGPPVSIERRPGATGREALAEANERIREALAATVADAVATTGLALPADDPNRTVDA